MGVYDGVSRRSMSAPATEHIDVNHKTSRKQQSESSEMNIKSPSVLAAAALALTSVATAAPKTYQVTGPVVEVRGDTIVVEKEQGKNEKWEINKGSAKGEVKVGDKVTVHYTMTATRIDNKGGGSASDEKKDEKKK